MLRNSILALIKEVFPRFYERILPTKLLRNSTILTLKNKVINKVNIQLLQLIPKEETISYLVNYYKNIDNISNFPIEFLYIVTIAILPLYTLYLKLSYLVILLRNLDLSNSLYNRTQLVILSISYKLLYYLIFRTRRYREVVQLPYIPLKALSTNIGVKFTHQQFPIKLTFTITINKAQGQSLSTISLLLNLEVFSYSQLYITLSRITRIDSIYIVLPLGDTIYIGRIKNIIYTKVLQ